jgi:hypothetical protein
MGVEYTPIVFLRVEGYMSEFHFNEEDKQKFIDFLNAVAKHATFDMNTMELVAYFKLLSHMQQKIIPKMEANILEIKRIIEPKEQAPAEEPAKSKGKKS